MVTITLANPFVDANPIVVCSGAGSSTAVLNPYASSTGKGTFIIGFQTAPTAGQTYYVNWVLVG